MEWQDRLIKTNVDKLLTYLSKHEEAPISQAADDLNVTETMIEIWASSLAEADLIEQEYSARQGKILKADIEAIKEKMDDFRESATTEMGKTASEIPHHDDISDAKEQLQTIVNAIEQQQQATEQIEDAIASIKEDEESFSQDEPKPINKDIIGILHEIDTRIGDINELDDRIQQFKQRKKNIQSDIEALNILETAYRKANEPSNVETMDQMDDKEKKEHLNKESTCNVCGETFKNKFGVKIHQSKMHTDEEINEASQDSTGSFSWLNPFG